MTGIYLFNADHVPTEIEHLSEEDFLKVFSAKPNALEFLYGVMQRVAQLESSLIDIGVYDPTAAEE